MNREHRRESAKKLFRGLFVPHVTPFSESGELDLGSLKQLTDHLAAQKGVAGFVSCARIGEAPVLSNEEKRRVYGAVGEVAQKAGLLHIATISPQSTKEAIEIVRDLETLPVDAVMIFPPLLFSWGKVAGELKYRFFEDIARSSDLPVVLFQVPVASYWYDAETVCRIAQLDGVVAYKEASFNINLFTETLRQLERSGSKMEILTGNDRFVAQSYMLGARGALIGVSNLATEKWGAVDQAGRAGDYQRAMALQEDLNDLKELVFSEPIVEAVSRIKTILQFEGLIKTATVRRPQLGVSVEEKGRLIGSYQELIGQQVGRARKTSLAS